MQSGLGICCVDNRWLSEKTFLTHSNGGRMLRSFTLMALSICTAASASAAGTNHDLGSAHKKGARVFGALVNKGVTFRDVKVGRHTYTLRPHELWTVKGPVGTVV